MRTFTFLYIILFYTAAGAQVIISVPDTVLEARGILFTVPVQAEKFNSVSAVSLVIKYDTASLKYTGVNALPEGFLVNENNGSIYIAFARIFPVGTGNQTLMNLSFRHIKGNSEITFTDESELADVSGEILPAVYNSGKITDPEARRGSIGDRVWIDINRNGIQDNNEGGLAWVTIDLFDCGNKWLAYTLTDAEGYYKFEDLEEGEYNLQFSLIDNNSGYTFTGRNAGIDSLIDSDVEMINDHTAATGCIILNEGEELIGYDAGVFQATQSATDYTLSQNFPNPFNTGTSINYTVGEAGPVNITIFNILGEKVSVLLNETKPAGVYTINFNASELKSGVYFYRLITPNTSITRKMILSR